MHIKCQNKSFSLFIFGEHWHIFLTIYDDISCVFVDEVFHDDSVSFRRNFDQFWVENPKNDRKNITEHTNFYIIKTEGI